MKIVKRLSGIILIIAVLCIIMLTIIGNYFVNVAIKRRTTGYDRSNVYASEEEEAAANEQYSIWAEDQAEAQAWLDTVSYSENSITSNDGLNLKAYEILQDADNMGNQWAILVHGYSSNKESMLHFAEVYYEKGYNILIPDLRAHGESEGKYIGMGWLDKNDMLLWISKVISVDPDSKIVLHGVSMGAATVMMTAGEPELQYNVEAVIEDCGYTSAWDIFSSELSAGFQLPQFPIMNATSIFAKLRAGYDFKEASALVQAKRCKVPMLFIHGEADDFVPFEMVYELYDAAICEKALLTVKGAGHGASETTDSELYWSTVFDFLGQ